MWISFNNVYEHATVIEYLKNYKILILEEKLFYVCCFYILLTCMCNID